MVQLEGYQSHKAALFNCILKPFMGSGPDSNPIPVVGNYDWNLNLCNVKNSA